MIAVRRPRVSDDAGEEVLSCRWEIKYVSSPDVKASSAAACAGRRPPAHRWAGGRRPAGAQTSQVVLRISRARNGREPDGESISADVARKQWNIIY
ncbi:hypothetical protein EVAR_79133_1 [Eumeta japonica]|uniref:Uncharacterized protein n=1 Tax=Eumeta variegata TaxID=151549 RepID=A0A4C1UUV3_EUMVA|nr:hypothetical protein EVAR_79133_1 [Eumeta japonica]